MPFTVAHAAAALPFSRSRIPLSALIAGCLAPDFEYFLRLEFRSTISHTLLGLSLFCLPVGLAILLIFHRLLKQPLYSLLPESNRARLSPFLHPFSFLPLKRLAVVAIGVMLGAASHLVWDTFTHSYGWAVVRLSALSAPVFETEWGVLRVYKCLQHGSTLFGFTVLGIAYWRWHRRAPRMESIAVHVLSEPKRRLVLVGMIGVTIIASLTHAAAKVGLPASFNEFRQLAGRACLAGIVSAIVLTLLYSACWHLWYRRTPDNSVKPNNEA